jgi:tight adherence protein B
MAIAALCWLYSRGRRASELAGVKARLSGAEDAKARFAPPGAALIQTENLATGKVVLKLLLRMRLKERLKLAIEQAGLKWSVARTMHGCLALFLVAFTAVWYMAPSYRPAAPIAGAASGALPVCYILRRRRLRLKKLEEQFPATLEFLSRAMRAGHAFSVSLEMIHSEFEEPISGEFKRVFDEQNLGMPLEAALTRMAGRAPSLDVHFFVSAVLLQKRTGGNLSEVLDKLASLIRERFKLRGRIRAISAHGRMTGAALSVIPVAVGLMMCWVTPGYAHFFAQDDSGRIMLCAAAALQIIGYTIIRKIVSIEV